MTRSNEPDRSVTNKRSFAFSLRTLLLLLLAIAAGLAWFNDHRRQAQRIAALEALDQVVVKLSGQSWTPDLLRKSMIESAPSWSDLTKHPPLTIPNALAKTDETIHQLNLRRKVLNLHPWKLVELRLIPLIDSSFHSRLNDKWCYMAEFSSLSEDPVLNGDQLTYSTLIMMDGSIYESVQSYRNRRQRQAVQAMQGVYPTPKLGTEYGGLR